MAHIMLNPFKHRTGQTKQAFLLEVCLHYVELNYLSAPANHVPVDSREEIVSHDFMDTFPPEPFVLCRQQPVIGNGMSEGYTTTSCNTLIKCQRQTPIINYASPTYCRTRSCATADTVMSGSNRSYDNVI